jgi:hypothetical protein
MGEYRLPLMQRVLRDHPPLLTLVPSPASRLRYNCQSESYDFFILRIDVF